MPPLTEAGLTGLAMLADTVRETSRSQTSGDSDDSGLLALSAVADDVEGKDPADSLQVYAKAVEKEVNLQLESLRYGQIIAPQMADPIAEIKDIVSHALDATKRRLGRGTVVTATTLLPGSNNPSAATPIATPVASLPTSMTMPSCG